MKMLFDATDWLLYFPEHLDTRRSLWFVRDVADLDAWRGKRGSPGLWRGL